MSGSRKTYCLRVVIDILNSQGLSFRNWSPQTGLLVESGVITNIAPDFSLSIQTHPIITGEAFTETALHFKQNLVYTENWLYYDVRRQYSPEEFAQHLAELVQALDGYVMLDDNNGIRTNHGHEIKFLPGRT